MTYKDVIDAAKGKVSNRTDKVNWNLLFEVAMNEVFTEKTYGFSTQEIVFRQPAFTFEKVFDADVTEKSLVRLISARQRGATQYVIAIPPTKDDNPDVGNSGELHYTPVQTFYEMFPNPKEVGVPCRVTVLRGPDGTNGMRIGLYPLGSSEFLYAVLGEFIPVLPADAKNDTSVIPILPRQFHHILINGVAYQAALDLGMEKSAATERMLFDRGIQNLRIWDNRNPKYAPQLGRDRVSMYPIPQLPADFDRHGR